MPVVVGEVTPEVAAQQIRFALSRLAARNAHHLFEEVCRHFAVARISRNILPATGPVGRGGDQGRDFETFRAYISDRLPGSFMGTEYDQLLVFACTLQSGELPRKIRQDLTAIAAGMPAEAVYVFCEADLPLSQRHQLTAWAQREYGITLEVIDGTGLAEQLAQSELFWIAERYLAISASMRPGYPASPGQTYGEVQAGGTWDAETAPPDEQAEPQEPAQVAGSRGATGEPTGHAFISYIREDAGEVDALQHALEAAGVRVWRDTSDLWPGEDWRARIRDAISRNALVFIACFSRRGVMRRKSYQNEELAIAVDQLRLRRPDVPWLIPVRLDDCVIPDLDIGGGRILASLQCADLFGDRRDEQGSRLVAAVLRILGQSPVSACAAGAPPVSESQRATGQAGHGHAHLIAGAATGQTASGREASSAQRSAGLEAGTREPVPAQAKHAAPEPQGPRGFGLSRRSVLIAAVSLSSAAGAGIGLYATRATTRFPLVATIPDAPPWTGQTRWVNGLAFRPDGRVLATAGMDHYTKQWDVASLQLLTPIGDPSTVQGVAFGPGGGVLAIASADHTAKLWNGNDPVPNHPLATLMGHEGEVYGVALSRDGQTLATASADHTIRLWNVRDPANPAYLATLTGHKDAVIGAAFSPDGHVLATGSHDRTAKLWDVTNPVRWHLLYTITGHAGWVHTPAFSPDSRILATASDDYTAKVWNVTDPRRPRLLHTITGHTGAVLAVAFTPRTGSVLATGSDDKTVKLWDVTNPAQPAMLATLTGHARQVLALAFSPTGSTLATGSADSTVKLWDTTSLAGQT